MNLPLIFQDLKTESVPEKIDSLVNNPSQVLTQSIDKVSNMSVHEVITSLIHSGMEIGMKILAAIIIYFIGAWIIRKIKHILNKILIKREVDKSLASFLVSFITIFLTIILIVMTVGALGVDTSSFVALLAGSGLAVGMALSGTLQNFAGGIMILLFKPFKIGDYIDAQGYTGTVKSIEMTTTHIATDDNKIVVLPNGALSNGTIKNFSISGTRRCDWKIDIAYGNDVSKAKEELLKIVKANKEIINEPAIPFAALASMNESSISIILRAWVKSQDYYLIYYRVLETIYVQLPKSGIEFPYPQIDVHLKRE